MIIEVKKNQAVVEESTEVVIALQEVSDSRKGLFTVTLPGKDPQQFPNRTVGDIWRFGRNGKKYRLSLLELSYITNIAKLELRLDPDGSDPLPEQKGTQ